MTLRALSGRLAECVCLLVCFYDVGLQLLVVILESTELRPGPNGAAGTDSYCAFDVATLFLKRALLMVACFMKYPTRVRSQEQKCSFGLHMYVPHRGAVVLEGSLYDLVH